MKSFKNYLVEAHNPKPSALKKFKKGTRKVQNEYIAGDIYDLGDHNRYTQTDEYYDANGDGYIMDKDGNVYNVYCHEGTEDSGRIAGGTTTKSVRIAKAGPDGKDLSFSGYHGLFSRPSSETFYSLISDIDNGMYLEDYLLKHKSDLNDYSLRKSDWFNDKIKDADGKSVADRKREKKIDAEEIFNQRYCVITDRIAFVDKGSRSLEFIYKQWSGDNAGKNAIVAKIHQSSTKNGSRNDDGAVSVPQELNDKIIDAFKELALEALSKIFGNADTKGMEFKFSISFEGQQKYGNGPKFAWDIKKNKFAVIQQDKRKVLDRMFELRLADICIDVDDKSSDFGIKLKKEICQYYVKNLGTESKYVADNYKAIQWGNGYWKPEMKAGEAKELCKQKFRQMKNERDYSPTKKVHALLETITTVLGKGNYEKFVAKDKSKSEEIKDPNEIQEITNGPDKPSSTSGKSAAETYGKAYGPAKEKMEKWHAGTRKQNLKNCNDGKLRMNFAICKELGYEEECKQIAAEAKKRGIILESKIGLSDYIQAIVIE